MCIMWLKVVYTFDPAEAGGPVNLNQPSRHSEFPSIQSCAVRPCLIYILYVCYIYAHSYKYINTHIYICMWVEGGWGYREVGTFTLCWWEHTGWHGGLVSHLIAVTIHHRGRWELTSATCPLTSQTPCHLQVWAHRHIIINSHHYFIFINVAMKYWYMLQHRWTLEVVC